MNMDSKLINNHCVHPPLSARGGGGALKGPQLLQWVCWERGGDFIQGACNCHIKINQNLNI